MSESINGWTPPTIYDMARDKTRIATQTDVDRMQLQLLSLGTFYNSVKKQVEELETTLARRAAT